MIKFLSLKPEAFGLDFSDLTLRIARLKKRGKFFNLASWGEIKLKPGIITEGEIKNEAALIESIKNGLKLIKGEKLGIKNVVVSLPEKKAFLQVIQMPKMEAEELETAVPFEAENYIPLPIDEVYLDFQVVNSFPDHFDVLITALPKKIIDSYIPCLKKSGLNPLALEIESQSISRAIIKNDLSPFPVFIIDFGKSTTSFIIFSGPSLRFTSSSSICSHNLTRAIAESLKIDLVEAEKLKLEYGLRPPKKTSKDKKASEAMMPVLTSLVSDIKKYLHYYQTHNHKEYPESKKMSQDIEKIFLCGKGANLKGLTDFLSFELKIPVGPGNPWVNILPQPLKEIPELSFEESLGYTTALGLALRGIRAEYD